MNPIPKDQLLDKALDMVATHFRVTKQKVWDACMMGTLPDHILSEGHMHIPGMSLRSLQYLLSHVLRAQKANAKTPIDPTFAPKVPVAVKKPTVKRRP